MTLPDINIALPSGVPGTESDEVLREPQTIHIVINPEVMALLRKESISINELFVLLGLYHEKILLLDMYDEKSTNNRVLLYEYQRMLIHGYLVQGGVDSTLIYDLSEKGKAFVEEVSLYFALEEDEKVADAEIKKLAQEYIALWPIKKLPSNSYARVSLIEIEKKLKGFFKTYKRMFWKEYHFKLTNQDILDTTKAYIARYEASGYMYMMNSSYFIQKREKSALADELIAIKTGAAEAPSSMDKFTKRL